MRRVFVFAFVAAAVAAAIACGSSDGSTPAEVSPDGATPPSGGDGGTTDDATLPPADGGCTRTAAAADRPRKVVVSHPFGADAGAKTTMFEVLDLDAAGTLTQPSPRVTFSMGTALDTPIVFTPDGEIGLVAQDDGTVGVFRLPAGGGAPVVITPGFDGNKGFYAHAIVMAPDGSRAWVLDENTANNGGGVYELAIGCDGTPSLVGKAVPGDNMQAMALVDATHAVLSARKAFDSAAGKDFHLIDLAAKTTIASAAPFGDNDAIVSSIAVTPDGKYALVSDDGAASSGDRLAVVALSPTAVTQVTVLTTPFPAMVVASPYDNAAIVLNDDSTDQIHVLSYTPASTTTPFAITGELAYKFGKPQIPVTASLIDRGALKGTVFVGENVAARQLRFETDGKVTDVAKLTMPDGLENIVGVIGVQP